MYLTFEVQIYIHNYNCFISGHLRSLEVVRGHQRSKFKISILFLPFFIFMKYLEQRIVPHFVSHFVPHLWHLWHTYQMCHTLWHIEGVKRAAWCGRPEVGEVIWGRVWGPFYVPHLYPIWGTWGTNLKVPHFWGTMRIENRGLRSKKTCKAPFVYHTCTTFVVHVVQT